MFRRFEHLIDTFKPAPDTTPPRTVVKFYLHYLRQVWGCSPSSCWWAWWSP